MRSKPRWTWLMGLALQGLATWAAPVTIINPTDKPWTLVSEPRSTVLRTTVVSEVLGTTVKVWTLPDNRLRNAPGHGGLTGTAWASYLETRKLVLMIPPGAKASTAIQYAYDYTSVGAPAMAFEIHVRVEKM